MDYQWTFDCSFSLGPICRGESYQSLVVCGEYVGPYCVYSTNRNFSVSVLVLPVFDAIMAQSCVWHRFRIGDLRYGNPDDVGNFSPGGLLACGIAGQHQHGGVPVQYLCLAVLLVAARDDSDG